MGRKSSHRWWATKLHKKELQIYENGETEWKQFIGRTNVLYRTKTINIREFDGARLQSQEVETSELIGKRTSRIQLRLRRFRLDGVSVAGLID